MKPALSVPEGRNEARIQTSAILQLLKLLYFCRLLRFDGEPVAWLH